MSDFEWEYHDEYVDIEDYVNTMTEDCDYPDEEYMHDSEQELQSWVNYYEDIPLEEIEY